MTGIRTIARWGALLLALGLLNASVTFANVWPTLGVRPTSELSIELAVCVTGLVLARRWRAALPPAALRGLAVAWVALVIGRYIDASARSLYGRDVNLYWDLQYLPDVGAMFGAVADPSLRVAAVGGAALAPVLGYLMARWAFGRVSDATESPRARQTLGVTAGGILALGVVTGSIGGASPAIRFAEPVSAIYVRELGELAYEMTGAGARALAAPSPIRTDLAHVRGADVFLIFLESYGAVSWDRSEFVEALSSSRARFEADVEETGRAVASAFVESTTFGGESRLAHISLLSGIEVRDERTNVRLMAQQRDTLVKAFGRHGYRTAALMPGLQYPWPQLAFYGFEELYDLPRLDYHGPPFGWWAINDQFALARLDALEIAPQPRRPVFVFFPTISTHAPFTPAPPYQPDWSRLLTTSPYDRVALDRAWADYPDWLNLGPSYVKGLTYAHATIGGYLRLRADRDLVIVLIGDHQPPALVSGEGASWNVPVHVITNRLAVLDRLERHGFRAGLEPRHPEVARMDTLLPVLLDAFGADSRRAWAQRPVAGGGTATRIGATLPR